jgi:VWFA-related protein
MTRLGRSSVVLGLVAGLLAAPTGHAQQSAQAPPPQDGRQGQQGQPTDGQPPIFRSGINFVRVDVIVNDKSGNPIGNLKPEDFEITEQGKAQKIETFKLISLDGGLIPGPDGPPRAIRTDLDEETEAARDDVRLFAFFLDDYHVRRETSMATREQLARFVETQLGPSDMIGVMYPLQPSESVRMTRNHDAVMSALRKFQGVKYDYLPRNDYERQYQHYPTEIVEMIRNQVSMSALKGLIVRMGGLKEGRKALLLISEGYSYMLPPQLRDADASAPGSGNPSSLNPLAGQNSPLEERAAFFSGAQLNDDLRDITDLANRNNVAIYAIDPRGLATNEFGIDQNIATGIDRQFLTNTIEALRTLALQTDGRAIVNRNDLTVGMKQILRDSSAYYLLGYNSTFTTTDGKFHEIKVNVKRPGVQVRARRGYWAYTAADAARALTPAKPTLPKPVENALASVTQTSRSRVVRTWIGTERGANGKTRVTFVWEPAPKAAGDSRAADTPARVALTAVGPDGSPSFRGRIPDAAAPASALATQGPSRVTFEVPPGKMQLRLSVESARAEVLDSEVREISIPDLTTPQTALSTPTVFRARTVRDFQQIKADPQAVPTPSREFTRADRVFLRVAAYGPGTTPPAVTAKLLNRGGQAMADLAVANSAGGQAARDIDLTLATLPPGEYVVEIIASGEGEPVKELVGFRVTS